MHQWPLASMHVSKISQFMCIPMDTKKLRFLLQILTALFTAHMTDSHIWEEEMCIFKRQSWPLFLLLEYSRCHFAQQKKQVCCEVKGHMLQGPGKWGLQLASFLCEEKWLMDFFAFFIFSSPSVSTFLAVCVCVCVCVCVIEALWYRLYALVIGVLFWNMCQRERKGVSKI